MRIAWDDDEAALGKFLRSQDSGSGTGTGNASSLANNWIFSLSVTKVICC
jgi:hypothetical protein